MTAPTIPAAPVIVITGVQASGKSTVAQLLAESLPKAVHVRGDLFRRMVVSGQAAMTAPPTPEMLAQLSLRHRLAASVADGYAEAGFTAVLQDIYLEDGLTEVIAAVRTRPLIVVTLDPDPVEVARREHERPKSAYGNGITVDYLVDALRERTPKLGLRLNTTDQTPSETVAEIHRRAWTEGLVA